MNHTPKEVQAQPDSEGDREGVSEVQTPGGDRFASQGSCLNKVVDRETPRRVVEEDCGVAKNQKLETRNTGKRRCKRACDIKKSCLPYYLSAEIGHLVSLVLIRARVFATAAALVGVDHDCLGWPCRRNLGSVQLGSAGCRCELPRTP